MQCTYPEEIHSVLGSVYDKGFKKVVEEQGHQKKNARNGQQVPTLVIEGVGLG